ncbi:unnamed protein product [Pleuronectes platessa]|uniref:Uncharacterized protein n=1 Tax=Pleuronectes platessa TaxID=8262 RepID=A0A9N7VZ21_PLEPL|nr:unnamed protein product [Pleuronectes platessa]
MPQCDPRILFSQRPPNFFWSPPPAPLTPPPGCFRRHFKPASGRGVCSHSLSASHHVPTLSGSVLRSAVGLNATVNVDALFHSPCGGWAIDGDDDALGVPPSPTDTFVLSLGCSWEPSVLLHRLTC